jgi:hypothetical protein
MLTHPSVFQFVHQRKGREKTALLYILSCVFIELGVRPELTSFPLLVLLPTTSAQITHIQNTQDRNTVYLSHTHAHTHTPKARAMGVTISVTRTPKVAKERARTTTPSEDAVCARRDSPTIVDPLPAPLTRRMAFRKIPASAVTWASPSSLQDGDAFEQSVCRIASPKRRSSRLSQPHYSYRSESPCFHTSDKGGPLYHRSDDSNVAVQRVSRRTNSMRRAGKGSLAELVEARRQMLEATARRGCPLRREGHRQASLTRSSRTNGRDAENERGGNLAASKAAWSRGAPHKKTHALATISDSNKAVNCTQPKKDTQQSRKDVLLAGPPTQCRTLLPP